MNHRSSIEKISFFIEIDVVGPLLTRSVDARHFSEDQLGLTVDGRPALPGTLVKGVLRSALSEILESLSADHQEKKAELEDLVSLCFGPPVAATSIGSQDAEDEKMDIEQRWDPDRGGLNFSGHWLAGKDDCRSTTLTRIRISEATGTVEPGALVVARSPLQPGQVATFRGDVETWLPSDAIDKFLHWFGKAKTLIGAVGGATTVGFGEVTDIRISPVETLQPDESEFTSSVLEFGFALRLDRPFCFARPHGRGNVLSSQRHIPGGAIIGAVAETLGKQEDRGLELLRRNLHAIHVSHGQASSSDASSSQGEQRASPLPLSLACRGNGAPLDLASKFSGDQNDLVFSPDWKPSHRAAVAEAVPNWRPVDLRRVTVVRNAIDPMTGAAAESALFAFDAIDPSGHQWRFNAAIDPASMNTGDQGRAEEVLDQFRRLLAMGLIGLGKTKARAAVELRDEPWQQAFAGAEFDAEAQSQPGSTFRMLLVTDADLLGPVEQLHSTGGQRALRGLYQAYFDRAFGEGRLELQHWYTNEVLAGGRYIQGRFWRSKGKAPYRPHVKTSAGSVFVLRVADELDDAAVGELRASFAHACRFGLTPGPVLLESGAGDTVSTATRWQRHPWLPAQGYGEILLQPDLGLDKESENYNDRH